MRLDWLGFLLLSAALASTQLMLDRGERADWFDSAEIVTWAALAGLALYAFIAHSATAERPFLDPRLLADRNFSIGIVLVFVFGMLNFTPMTLLPPMLQGVSGYPDSVIGFVLGARGLGTMIGFFLMIFASRLDPRAMIVLGFLLQAIAGWQLAHLDVNPSTADVFWPMALQGLGVGVLWVPITMVSFSTLDAGVRLRGVRGIPHGAQHRLERPHLAQHHARGPHDAHRLRRARRARHALQRIRLDAVGDRRVEPGGPARTGRRSRARWRARRR